MRRFSDEDAGLHPDHADGLAQHHLELSRVAVPAPCELDHLRARRDRAEVDDRALRLRDHLLRDDEDIVLSEWQRAWRRVEGGEDRRWEVIARHDLRDAL